MTTNKTNYQIQLSKCTFSWPCFIFVATFDAQPRAEHRLTTHKRKKRRKTLALGKGIAAKLRPWLHCWQISAQAIAHFNFRFMFLLYHIFRQICRLKSHIYTDRKPFSKQDLFFHVICSSKPQTTQMIYLTIRNLYTKIWHSKQAWEYLCTV